jgi:hypothetical protein
MKRKLCPFDKLECVGESCMLFSINEENCGLVRHCSPAILPIQDEKPKLSRDNAHGNHEKKSRFTAELFD